MTKEKSKNGRVFKITLAVCTFVAIALLAWGANMDAKVDRNTGDIREIKTVIKMGFVHLEAVIKEGRK